MKIRSGLVSACLTFAALSPAHAQLININARVSGASPGNGQTFWHDPFNGVALTLAPGTYNFRVVDPAINSSALYTAWTYNRPWLTTYLVFDASNLTHELFETAVPQVLYPTAQSAFDATVADGLDLTIHTFTSTTELLFTLPDNVLGDNTGGVSIAITSAETPPPSSAVPEPSTYGALAAAALIGIVLLRRRSTGCLR